MLCLGLHIKSTWLGFGKDHGLTENTCFGHHGPRWRWSMNNSQFWSAEMSPGVLKNIRLKLRLEVLQPCWLAINATAIPCISWWESWHSRHCYLNIIYHNWYRCQPWMHLWFAETFTANIIFRRLGWNLTSAKPSMKKYTNEQGVSRSPELIPLTVLVNQALLKVILLNPEHQDHSVQVKLKSCTQLKVTQRNHTEQNN